MKREVSAHMNCSLSEVPFSRYGSYLSFLQCEKDKGCGIGLYLRVNNVNRTGKREAMRLEVLVDGVSVPFETAMSSTVLELKAGERCVRLCITDVERDTVRVYGRGAGLRLRVVPGVGTVAQPVGPQRWAVNCFANVCRFMVDVLRGDLRADCPWAPRGAPPITLDLLPGNDGILDAAVDRYESTWVERARPMFSQCVGEVGRDWKRWLAIQPTVGPGFREARELAAYTNWESVIRAGGLLKRPGMLMSKVWMDNVWSWDHCFNALALCYKAPEQAFDQFMVMFDRQDEFGALPDAINPGHEHFNYSKPPVHGWALRFMMDRSPGFFDKVRLKEVYAPLAAWTDWWLTHRRMPGEELPYYLHGNDSGWDNSTIFDAGAPLVSPDLASFLAIQCDVVGEIAARLGKAKDARRWRGQAERLVASLLSELWKDDGFVGRRSSDGFEVRCDSLVPLMPVVLGRRLPVVVADTLVAGIKKHLTKWGLATELTGSPQYESDGYWRGPIWAPSTMLIVDGLAAQGEKALADEIAKRFCRLCVKSGFAENFDARSGAPLRDTAYTWTASVFLVLAHECRK